MKRIASAARNALDFLREGIWRADTSGMPRARRAGIGFARFASVAAERFVSGRCSLHAAGLTYFTLLSVVPILCLLLLLAKTLGAGDFARERINTRIDSMIAEVELAADAEEANPGAAKDDEKGFFDSFMSAIGKADDTAAEAAEQKKKAARALAAQARDVSNHIFNRIDAFNVDTLGWVGLVMLMWTVVSTLGMVEKSCNEIWGVKKTRALWKQFSLYVFISVALPLLVTAALSVPVLKFAVKAIEATMGQLSVTKDAGAFIRTLLESRVTGFLFTYFFASAAFACFYVFMPNTRVSLRSAAEAGFIASLLFASWLKLCAAAQVGVANSSALYGSFAFLPIVLAWVYVSWQIVLFGSVMSYAFECVHSGVRRVPVVS